MGAVQVLSQSMPRSQEGTSSSVWGPAPSGVCSLVPRKEGEQLSTSPGLLPVLSAPIAPPDSVSPPPTCRCRCSPSVLLSPPLSLFLSFSALPSVRSFGQVLPVPHMCQRWVGGDTTERILALPGPPG